ncbi:MAG TPA: hypothetical protein PL167_09780 [Cyclobacteriaceae bacterium]|nr:hypothetical protein [Cyclobacteriaceae bacterium]
MKVSSEQIAHIREVIDQSSITIETLKDDLLDHLCCVVEVKMTNGSEFEISLKEALDELAPDGLNTIQRETIFLLNSTKIILMKKIMYSIGLITSIAMTMGILAKLLHWPGAEELFTYGFVGFLLLFLPMLAIDRYKHNLSKSLSEKLRIGFGYLSAFLIVFSIFFKLFHLDGANLLLLSGMCVFSFGFLPFLFFNMYKKSVS